MMARRQTIRKCSACKRGKHSECAGHFSDQDDRLCPCCGELSPEERITKETEIKETRARKQKEEREAEEYRNYSSVFDSFVGRLKRERGIDMKSVGQLLPKTDEEIATLATELEMPIDWLTQFIDEHQEDYPGREEKT